jgi:hypothetical protein
MVVIDVNRSGNNDPDDVVYLPVPRKYLIAVIQALAQISEGEEKMNLPQSTTPATPMVPWPTPEQPVEAVEITWDEENLKNLRSKLKNRAALTVLDKASAMPGQPVHVEDIMKELDCTHGQVGAGLGVLTKCIRKMFNLKNKNFNWPAPFHWDSEKQLAYYTMEEDIARAWKATAKT